MRTVGSSIRLALLAGLMIMGLSAGCDMFGGSGGSGGGGTSGGGGGDKSTRQMPLVYRPTDSPEITTIAGDSLKVYIAPVTDARTDMSKIGENREESKPVTIVGTGQSPADFVAAGLKEWLGRCGIKVVPSADQADLTLATKLTLFWAEESPNYHSQVTLSVQLQNKAGATLWSGTATGMNRTFGRSLYAENYQQVLSNATLEAVAKIVNDPGFRKQVTPAAAGAGTAH